MKRWFTISTRKLNVSYENKSDVQVEELSLRFNEQYIFTD